MIEPTTGREMGCYLCKHFNKKTRLTCAAFPDGIPSPIVNGEIAHLKPYPGDHGIVFEVDLSRYEHNP